jgi:hypothetical protein
MSDAIAFDNLADLTDPQAGANLADELDNRFNALKNTVNGSPGILFARDTESESGLIAAWFDGRVFDGATVTLVAGGTETLDANSTNYLEVGPDGVVSHNTTGFTDSNRPIAEITTDGASITDFVDKRVGFDFSGSGAGIKHVTQAAHGFVVGNWLQPDGADGCEKAQADTAAHANTVGKVVAVQNVDAFTLQTSGYDATGSGMTPGFAQFLDPDTAGAQTEAEGWAVGEIRQVLGVAISATEMIINIGTGFEIQADPHNVANPDAISVAGNIPVFSDTSGEVIEDSGVPIPTNLIVQAVSSTIVTAGAPNTNTGYATIIIDGVSIKVMVCA